MKLRINKPSLLLYSLIIVLLPVSLGVFTGDETMNISLSDFLIPFAFIQAVGYVFIRKDVSDSESTIFKRVVLWLAAFSVLTTLSLVSVALYNGAEDDYFKKSIIDLVKIYICVMYAFTFLVGFLFFKKSGSLWRVTNAFTISVFLFSLTCVFGYVLNYLGFANPFVHNGFRARGTMLDTNLAACYLLSLIGFPLYQFFTCKKTKYLVPVATSLIAIISTGSKAALLILILSVFLFIVLMLLFHPKNLKWIVPFFVLGTACVLFFGSRTGAFDVVLKRFKEIDASSIATVTTGRSNIWGIVFDILFKPGEYFAIRGIGIGMYRTYQWQYVGGSIAENSYVHNTFLSIWVETGVVNFILVTLSYLVLIFRLLKESIKKSGSGNLALFLSFFAMFLYMNSVSAQNNRFIYILTVFVVLFSYSKENKMNYFYTGEIVRS